MHRRRKYDAVSPPPLQKRLGGAERGARKLNVDSVDFDFFDGRILRNGVVAKWYEKYFQNYGVTFVRFIRPSKEKGKSGWSDGKKGENWQRRGEFTGSKFGKEKGTKKK